MKRSMIDFFRAPLCGFMSMAHSTGVSVSATTPEMAAAGQAMLWHQYDSLQCPVLLLRGAESDLLSAATAQAMAERGTEWQQ